MTILNIICMIIGGLFLLITAYVSAAVMLSVCFKINGPLKLLYLLLGGDLQDIDLLTDRDLQDIDN